MRAFNEPKLLIASGNKGKIKEIDALLAPFSVQVVSATEFNLEEPEENGLTFSENALIKAKYYCQQTGLPALADDSGLSVAALNGAPGIYSARWAGKDRDFNHAMKRVEQEVNASQSSDKSASFICALALYWPDGHYEVCEGSVNGTLNFPPTGAHGFGYDPIFIPNGYQQTFAQMDTERKKQLSHRTDAFKKLVQGCFSHHLNMASSV